jgi:hypothetical protein
MVATMLSAVATPLAGHLSDRVGCKRSRIAGKFVAQLDTLKARLLRPARRWPSSRRGAAVCAIRALSVGIGFVGLARSAGMRRSPASTDDADQHSMTPRARVVMATCAF